MRILVTGGNGFLGQQILKEYPNVITVGRNNSQINADLRFDVPVIPSVDMVIHAAGKAHVVPKNEEEAADFFRVNVRGTQNLLNGIGMSFPKYFIYISSVAVYGLSVGLNVDETAPLLATDPYGASKIEAEKIVRDWCEKNKVVCTILRLPLLVGENPPGNLGALILGVKKGYYFNIGGGSARKSMVAVHDVVKSFPAVYSIGGIYNLTDGYHPSFVELSRKISTDLNVRSPWNMPIKIASVIALFGNLLGNSFPLNVVKLKKITSPLTFNDGKAREAFGWKSTSVLESVIIKK